MTERILDHTPNILKRQPFLFLVHQRKILDILIHWLLQPKYDTLYQIITVCGFYLRLAIFLNLVKILISYDLIFKLNSQALVLSLSWYYIILIVKVLRSWKAWTARYCITVFVKLLILFWWEYLVEALNELFDLLFIFVTHGLLGRVNTINVKWFLLRIGWNRWLINIFWYLLKFGITI